MPADYPLVQSAAEYERLRRQHETWRPATETLWRAAGFAPGQAIADLGCGPGFTTRDLARLVGARGRVVAVDASSTATAALRAACAADGLSNVDVITGDVATVHPGRALDGAFARWLFCYVADPDSALRNVARHLRPGGVLAVLDYWNYLAIRTEPRSPLFDRTFAAVYRSFADAGGSLDVAGTLPKRAAAAGLTVGCLEPVCAIGRAGSPVWTWISEFQALYLPALVERGYLTAGDVDEYLAWWVDLERSGDAFVFAPPMLAIVMRCAPDRSGRDR